MAPFLISMDATHWGLYVMKRSPRVVQTISPPKIALLNALLSNTLREVWAIINATVIRVPTADPRYLKRTARSGLVWGIQRRIVVQGTVSFFTPSVKAHGFAWKSGRTSDTPVYHPVVTYVGYYVGRLAEPSTHCNITRF